LENGLIEMTFYCCVESLPVQLRGVSGSWEQVYLRVVYIVPAPNASMLTITQTGMSCTSGTLAAEKGLNGDGHAPADRAFCALFAHLGRNCVQLFVFAPVISAGHFSLSLFRVFLAFRVAPRAVLANQREKEGAARGIDWRRIDPPAQNSRACALAYYALVVLIDARGRLREQASERARLPPACKLIAAVIKHLPRAPPVKSYPCAL